MAGAITPWLHILGVAIWVGPQFFLFIAAVPAARTIEDERARARLMRVMTTRFGWMAWAALALIVTTGISNYFQVNDDFGGIIDDPQYRWLDIFSLKMVLVVFMVLLTAVHSFIVGPRLLALSEQENPDREEQARLRRSSMMISGLILLLSVGAIFLGALLAQHDYSLAEG
jgi:uncharacterized membrane protein